MRCLWLLLRLCLASSSLVCSLAADEPVPTPLEPIGESDPIRWPKMPSPVGPPAPQSDIDLPSDRLFVIERNSPFTIVAEPVGIVAMSLKTGPYPVFSRFADGSGEFEERVIAGKYIILVMAKAKGRVALIEVKDFTTPDDKRVRQYLNVMGPRPPPIPPEPEPPIPPEPGPDPTPVPVASFRVIFVKESGSTLSAEQTAIPGAKAIRDYLNAKTTKEAGVAGWREYDPQQNTANEQPTMKALWAAVQPKIQAVPVMVVEVNGHATVRPFPVNVAEALTVLELAGGK